MKLSTEDYVLGAIAAFLVGILVFGGNGAGGSSPEDLGKKVFAAVKSGDAKAAQSLAVSMSDMQFMVEQSPLPAEAKEKAQTELKANEGKMKEDIDRFWGLLLARLATEGYDLDMMEMGTPVVEEQKAKGMLTAKLEGAQVKLPFTSGDKQGTLQFAAFHHGKWRYIPPIGLMGEDVPEHHGKGPHGPHHGHGH